MRITNKNYKSNETNDWPQKKEKNKKLKAILQK